MIDHKDLSSKGPPKLVLTTDDQAALASLKVKEGHLELAVQKVIEGYKGGVLCWGDGGIGKSWTVEQTLKNAQADFVLHNTHLTARGLYNRLHARSEATHWIEDAEQIFQNQTVAGILRSATWSTDNARKPIRQVDWGTCGGDSFIFTGGLVILSNEPPPDKSKVGQAVKNRMQIMEFSASREELIAKMKWICLKGFSLPLNLLQAPELVEDEKDEDEPDTIKIREDESEDEDARSQFVKVHDDGHTMTPEDCWEVGWFIVTNLDAMQSPLSLRLLKQGFNDFLYAKTHPQCRVTWQNSLHSLMLEKPSAKYVSRAELKDNQSDIAREIDAEGRTQAEKLAKWKERTGSSKAAFYRLLKRNVEGCNVD